MTRSHRFVALVAVALTALTLAACSGTSPAAPSTPPPPVPTTAQLTLRLDAACRGVNVLGADFFVDGQIVQAAASGGAFTMTVTIGAHVVEAASYYANRVQAYHWGPWTVSVPAAGYNQLFYCR